MHGAWAHLPILSYPHQRVPVVETNPFAWQRCHQMFLTQKVFFKRNEQKRKKNSTSTASTVHNHIFAATAIKHLKLWIEKWHFLVGDWKICSSKWVHLPQFLGWKSKIHPCKINMEHNHEGLVQIIFLSKWVIYSFHLNLPGCSWVATTQFLSNLTCLEFVGFTFLFTPHLDSDRDLEHHSVSIRQDSSAVYMTPKKRFFQTKTIVGVSPA